MLQSHPLFSRVIRQLAEDTRPFGFRPGVEFTQSAAFGSQPGLLGEGIALEWGYLGFSPHRGTEIS